MNLTCIGFGAVIIVAGVLFAFGVLLPKAWKEMSDDEKAKVKIKPLCINVGAMIGICGAILLIKGLCSTFSGKAFLFTMIAWLVLSGIDVFFIYKSRRYHNK